MSALAAEVSLPPARNKPEVDFQRSDWELFQEHCLHNGAMTLESLGDIWDDVTGLHIPALPDSRCDETAHLNIHLKLLVFEGSTTMAQS